MNIFISHIHEEASLAFALKQWLESTFAERCRVFASSDSSDISLGDKWLDRIDHALSDATVLLVLCSPISVSRPWVNFEAGCGWIKRVPIIPVCHSGQLRNELELPLSAFQALDLETADSCEALVKGLADRLQIKRLPRISYKEMAQELAAASQTLPIAASKPETRSSVKYVSRNKYYFLSGCAVGKRIELLPLPPGVRDDGSLSECLDAMKKAGLGNTEPYLKIARVQDIAGPESGVKEDQFKAIVQDYLDAMRVLPEIAQQVGSEEEFAWFNLGRLLLEIPTLIITGGGDMESAMFAVTALEMSADRSSFPATLRNQILQYVQTIRTGADVETIMKTGRELSQAISMLL